MFWLAEADTEERGATDDFWYQPVGHMTASRTRVTPDRSLALPAVYACVRVITDAMMQIPLILYRHTGEDGRDKERVTDDDRYRLLHDQPNDNQTAPEWREIMQHHLLLRGNAYSEKIVNGAMRLQGLSHPHHPDFVKVEPIRDARMRLRARYRFEPMHSWERQRILEQDQVLHIRGLATDGFRGLSPIEAERESVGVGLAAQDFMARFIGNDARPGGVIESEKNFPNKASRERFRESFEEAHRGTNRHRTAVLEFGMKYKPIDVRLVDAQFLEMRKYQNHEIARIFRVPPHMIMEMDRATFNNIEHQSISFVKNTMLPWLVRWEKRLAASLLGTEDNPADEGLFFEFLVDGLERGDLKTRTQHYHFGIQDGYLTRNEVRQMENRNRLDGLDEPLQPMNMGTAGDMPNEDEEDRGDRRDAFERDAAEALARKQAHEMRNAAKSGQEPKDYLRASMALVSERMLLPEAEAWQVLEDAAADLDEVGLTLEDWQMRHVDRLLEASRSL